MTVILIFPNGSIASNIKEPQLRVQLGLFETLDSVRYFSNASFSTPASRMPALRICCSTVGPKVG